MAIEFKTKTATQHKIHQHLILCDAEFEPPLHTRVDLAAFARKIFQGAVTFEAWYQDDLVALVSAYCNNTQKHESYINNVSVCAAYRGQGLADQLLRTCLSYAEANGFVKIGLEVSKNCKSAMELYKKHQFTAEEDRGEHLLMKRELSTNSFNQAIRDTADHKYAYSFDFDVMHPFMIRTFEPFFIPHGSVLELGSFKGDFTARLQPLFTDITCVEASDEAVAVARSKPTLKAVEFFEGTFEKVALPKQYDNIILTHVLEHLDDPVRVLSRIQNEWLSPRGRLFVACPNANAPSRQIAVNMGLISHNVAVTPSEAHHGHRITYTLDTLERDVRRAGLQVIHRSGVFFKALANFQWDRLLQTDIISAEYLEGCYQLGQKYPDLCSSIYLVCERGSK